MTYSPAEKIYLHYRKILFAVIITEKIFRVDKNFFDKQSSDKYNENQFSLRKFDKGGFLLYAKNFVTAPADDFFD